MKDLYDQISSKCSKFITRKYSTSFSLGIYHLDKSIHEPIYNIYGFVRLADEIVDSFHGFDKERLLKQFREDTAQAIKDKISLNPVLNSFQHTYHNYNIEWHLVDSFLKSMEMDLLQSKYNSIEYDNYIYGSAEVVGLMCLRVFTNGDHNSYEKLIPYAKKLGSAFQKINFLRDLHDDYEILGRTYFPNIDLKNISSNDKRLIESEIELEFDEALSGIKLLPDNSKKGVYLAYVYYKQLFVKIKNLEPKHVLNSRIRINNYKKLQLMFKSLIRVKLNLL